MEKNNIFESRHGFRRRMTISWIAPRNVFQSVGIFLFHQSIQLPAGLKVLRVCVCVCVFGWPVILRPSYTTPELRPDRIDLPAPVTDLTTPKDLLE